MAPGRALTPEQQAQILLVLRSWIERDFGRTIPKSPAQGALF